MRFITDHTRLKPQLIRNPYPSRRIGESIYKVEGLQYTTKLYLNIVYYAISISLASHYMTTIVTEFGKFRYNRLPMVMCASGDIFQA